MLVSWEKENIKQTFEKLSYGDIDKINISLFKTLHKYKLHKNESKEFLNRIKILNELINYYGNIKKQS